MDAQLAALRERYSLPNIQAVMDEAIPAVEFDADFNILSATHMAAEFLNVPLEELVGSAIDVILKPVNNWSFMPWASSESGGELLLYALEEAAEQGTSFHRINVVTPGQMAYRGFLAVYYNPVLERFYVILPISDPMATKKASRGTTWITNDGKLGGRSGHRISREEVDLLRAYCRHESAASLAKATGFTQATVERRLRVLAERLGQPSLKALIRSLAARQLDDFPSAENTIRCYSNIPFLDHARFEAMSEDALPPHKHYMASLERDEARAQLAEHYQALVEEE